MCPVCTILGILIFLSVGVLLMLIMKAMSSSNSNSNSHHHSTIEDCTCPHCGYASRNNEAISLFTGKPCNEYQCRRCNTRWGRRNGKYTSY